MKFELCDYKKHHVEKDIDGVLKSIQISWDGGRLNVVVNGKTVFESKSVDNSFHIDVEGQLPRPKGRSFE